MGRRGERRGKTDLEFLVAYFVFFFLFIHLFICADIAAICFQITKNKQHLKTGSFVMFSHARYIQPKVSHLTGATHSRHHRCVYLSLKHTAEGRILKVFQIGTLRK
jgi:hypothetical protein